MLNRQVINIYQLYEYIDLTVPKRLLTFSQVYMNLFIALIRWYTSYNMWHAC